MPEVYSLDSYSPYPSTFSPEKHAKSLKEHAFPVTKRGPAQKCEGANWLQKGSRCSFLHNGESSEVLGRNGSLSVDEKKFYSTPQGIVQLNKKGISIALERRLALILQQMISCYKMSDFVFSARGANDQIGSSPSMKLTSTDKESVTHKREAAHSSTIPTLIAHAKDGSTPDGIVYMRGGSSDAQHNATVGMHECVNGADELIDGNGNDKKLRATAVKILNLVAGGLDPRVAMQQFLIALNDQVVATRDSLDDDDLRKHVLERYHKKVIKIQEAAEYPEFYDHLLGVIIKSDDKAETKLREIVYRKRYDIILLQDVIESRIGKKIDSFRQNMNARDKTFVEYILLKEFSETHQRQVVEKLFGKTAAIFEEGYEAQYGSKELKSLKSFKTRVTNLQGKHDKNIKGSELEKIPGLLRDLRADFRELSCAEMTYRAGVFKDLRTKFKNWTQKEFCAEYFKKFAETISQTFVSRLENLSRNGYKLSTAYKSRLGQRMKLITLDDAKKYAKTFDIDVGLFLPCLFTS
jgi:hypothetical protein